MKRADIKIGEAYGYVGRGLWTGDWSRASRIVIVSESTESRPQRSWGHIIAIPGFTARADDGREFFAEPRHILAPWSDILAVRERDARADELANEHRAAMRAEWEAVWGPVVDAGVVDPLNAARVPETETITIRVTPARALLLANALLATRTEPA